MTKPSSTSQRGAVIDAHAVLRDDLAARLEDGEGAAKHRPAVGFGLDQHPLLRPSSREVMITIGVV